MTTKIINEQKTGSLYLKILGLYTIFKNEQQNLSYDEILLNVAIPQNEDIPLNFSQKKIKNLGKINLDNDTIIKQLKISARLERNGNIRGVPVANLIIQPFEYNAVTHELFVIESAEISLKFPDYVTVENPSVSKVEEPFFAPVANKKQLNFFLKLRNNFTKKNKDIILSNNKWYSPGNVYLKITTSKDGIAMINGSDIINNINYFEGKETKFLHLLYKGMEHPLYFLNDTNGILDASDSILFTGKRAIGDTTWLNVFTNYAVFYLYYDNSYEGARLALFPEINGATDNIKKVNINKHIEYDKIYYRSYVDVQIETETMPGEGWYWSYISSMPEDPTVKVSFSDSELLNPDISSIDSLSFSFFLRSMFYNDQLKDTSNTYHQIEAFINNDSILIERVPYRQADTLTFTFPQNKMYESLNNLKLQSVPTYDLLNRPESPDDVGIDYINIAGSIQPYAFNGAFNFQVTTGNNNSTIDITGMNTPFIAVVDTVKNLIQFPSSDKGTFIRMGTLNSTKPYTNIIINDSILSDTSGQGLHVAVLNAPDFMNYQYNFYNTYETGLKNYLNSIPAGSIVCIANNSDDLIPLDIRNIITNLGSKEINNRVSGQSWLFVVRKGDTNSVEEKRIVNGKASIGYFIKHQNGKSFIAHLKLPAHSDYHLIVRDASSIENAKVETVNPTNLADTNQQADVIIITHKNFLETADSLAAYRRRTNHLNINVVNVEDIYKEFNYGFKSPHAIKNFLKYAYLSWGKPALSCLILVGDASWDSRKEMPTSIIEDYVPSYGWPSSDYWYTLLDSNDLNGDMAVGRIPIDSNRQGMDYIRKLMEYDSTPTRPWMKRFLFLSGGETDNERAGFYFYSYTTAADYIIPSELCGDTVCVGKRDINTGGETESGEIISDINSGAVWTNFLGHGSPTLFDMDGWYVTRLNNKPKYGILSVLSCNSGAFTEPDNSCRNEGYILEPDKGFIAALGSTSAGDVSTDETLLINMIHCLDDTSLNIRQTGDILLYGKKNLYKGGFEGRYTTYQFTLLGDPLTKIRIQTKPDLYTIPNEINIKNQNGESLITENDSTVNISGTIYNDGYCQSDSVKFLIIREYETSKDTYQIMIPGICNNYPFSAIFKVNHLPGQHKVTIIIDPDFILEDADWSNNTSVLTFDVLSEGLLPVEPLAFWDTRINGPIFRVIDPKCSDNTKYYFEIRNSLDTLIPPVYQSSESEISDYKTYIDWKPIKRLENNHPYWFVGYRKGGSDLGKSKVLWLPFITKSSRDSGLTKLTMSGYEQLSQNKFDSLSVTIVNDTAQVNINNLLIPFIVDGANGKGTNIPRYAKIILDGKSYVDTVDQSNAPVGMNVVVASGIDGSYKAKRNFFTWESPDYVDAERFVRFLKDTVDSNDYVLLATCGSSFRAFWNKKHNYQNSIGSYDSLKAILREYGSILADSIPEETDVQPNSFVMLGKRGSPVGSIPEALDTTGGLAQISGNIKIPLKKGSLTTPTFGPAKHWQNFSIDGSFPTDESTYRISVIGISPDKLISQQLIEDSTTTSITLDSIPAKDFPYIKIVANIERLSDTANPYITSINCNFVPAPELSIVRESCIQTSDTIMRGDTDSMSFSVQNISQRIPSDPCILTVTTYNSSPTSTTFSLPALGIGQVKSYEYTFDTKSLEHQNQISAVIDPYRTLNELYTFNNIKQQQLIVYEDTIKPWIELRLDDSIPHDGDYVAIQPHIQIKLFDNSILPVDGTAIEVRVNATHQDSIIDSGWVFTPYPNRPLKATLSFICNSLVFGENIIAVMYSDATGNRDTTKVSVYVSLNGYIDSLYNYPNPFNNSTTFRFYLLAQHQGSIANIEIFNLNGQKVKSLSKVANIGENNVEWDSFDDTGNYLSSGMYFYRLSIQSDLYTEPVYGKLVIIRQKP